MSFWSKLFGVKGSSRVDIAERKSSQPSATSVATGNQPDSFVEAVQKGDLEKFKALLKSNPDLAVSKDRIGRKPLCEAAVSGHRVVVQLLLANKAQVNSTDDYCNAPLQLAARHGHKDVAELLLANKADANRGYRSPLCEAAANGHKDVAELLLANKADANPGDPSPLCEAAANGHKDVAELLLANGARVNAWDRFGRRPLHAAAAAGHKEVAELLLANKAKVNAKDKDGRTALQLAAREGHKDVAELLLGAAANQPEDDPTNSEFPLVRFEAIQSALAASYEREVKELVLFVKRGILLTYSDTSSRLSTDDLLNMGETGRQCLKAARKCAFLLAKMKLIHAAVCLRELRSQPSEQYNSENHEMFLKRAFGQVLSGKWTPPVPTGDQTSCGRLLSRLPSAYVAAAEDLYSYQYGPPEKCRDLEVDRVLGCWLNIGVSRSSQIPKILESIDRDIVLGVADAF